jgi:hypothetical protein
LQKKEKDFYICRDAEKHSKPRQQRGFFLQTYQRASKEKEAVMKFSFIGRARRTNKADSNDVADNRNYTLVRSGAPDLQWDLYLSLLSAFLRAPLPEQTGEQLASLRSRVRDNDPEFLAKLAVHLRDTMDLRELSFWLSAELAAIYGNDERTAQLLLRIVRQPAELPEWLGYYSRAGKKGNAGRPLRKAFDHLLNRVDEYAFGRYNKDLQTGLKEAIRLLRPKPADTVHKVLFGKILRDQLPVRSTWEEEWQTYHKHTYKSPEQRQVVLRDKWKEGISSFRIGYTALLNNLQPMLCAGVSGKVLKLAAEYLGNAVAVGKSGQSPLRLLETYRVLRKMDQGGAGMLSEALEQAAVHSAWNRTDLEKNKTWVIAMDVSNSMKHPMSGYNGIQRLDIGPLLAMLLKSRGESVVTGIIGNTWKPVDLPFRPILGGTDQFRLREGEAGYGINAHLILQDLTRRRQVADRILIFTDCRLWDNRAFNQPAGTDLGGAWRQYRQIAPQAKLYLFDLAGYGVAPLELREDDVFLVMGWHERIFDILQAVGNGSELTGM